jgi:hypothetical protein
MGFRVVSDYVGGAAATGVNTGEDIDTPAGSELRVGHLEGEAAEKALRRIVDDLWWSHFARGLSKHNHSIPPWISG